MNSWINSGASSNLIAGLFTSVTIVLLVFYYYTGLLWSRYTGHLFVILLGCYWLWQHKEMTGKPTNMGSWSLRLDKWRSPILTAMLAIGCVGGVISYILDLQKPFSTSAQAADYLRENKLDTGILIGLRDFTVSPLATHLGRTIYYAERDEPGTFVIFDEKWVPVNGIRELIPLFKRFHQQGHTQMILVKDNPIKLVWDDTGEEELWKDAMLTESLNLRLLTHVEPGVVKDEDYYIYAIEEKTDK